MTPSLSTLGKMLSFDEQINKQTEGGSTVFNPHDFAKTFPHLLKSILQTCLKKSLLPSFFDTSFEFPATIAADDQIKTKCPCL